MCCTCQAGRQVGWGRGRAKWADCARYDVVVILADHGDVCCHCQGHWGLAVTLDAIRWSGGGTGRACQASRREGVCSSLVGGM